MATFPAGDWLTVDEAVALLGVTRRRVQALAKEETVKSVLWNGQYYLDRADATRWMGSRKPGRPPKAD